MGRVGHGRFADFEAGGKHSRTADFINAVIGLRGRWSQPRGHVCFPFQIDYGRGGTTSSEQASLGVGYAFHWGDAAVAWRYLRVSQDAQSALSRSATLTGPSLQPTWHF